MMDVLNGFFFGFCFYITFYFLIKSFPQYKLSIFGAMCVIVFIQIIIDIIYTIKKRFLNSVYV